MKIPFVDLTAQHKALKNEIDRAFTSVIKNSTFIRGPHVDAFEKAFSDTMTTKYTVSCANGTDALYIALRSLKIKSDHEVIVPAHSWISTSQTVSQSGGKVVFCDTTPDTFTMCTNHLRSLINEKTVGIIPVHLFGQPADMDEICKIADENNLWIIEDCAQAHLAEYKTQKVGTFGIAGTYSFYPGKNLGAMGDAGAIVTKDTELMLNMTKFARHGGLVKGEHEIEGINSRMDGLQAAILNIKLGYLEKWTQQRQNIASEYLRNINNPNITLPSTNKSKKHVWHLFVIKTKHRDELASFLKGHGIATNINYKQALPFLPAYQDLHHGPNDFPNAFTNQSQILSIPIYPELKSEQVNYIIEKINDFKI